MKTSMYLSASALMIFCLLFFSASIQAQPTIVEDFKDSVDGFDLPWTNPVMTLGSGTPTFTSNGEIGTFFIDSSPWAAAVTQTAATYEWNPANQRYAQIMVPDLVFGERSKVFVFTSANGYAVPYLLHNEWFEIPGQGPRPQTFDVNAVLPTSDPQYVLFRLELIDQPYGEPTRFAVDWFKAGMPESASPAPGVCGFVGPASGAESVNPPTFEWTAPAGYAGNTYTLTYGKQPADPSVPVFSDDTTVTILDGVTGTSYTPSEPLSAGTWFWTVSATSAGGLSGPFLEAAAPIGDSRDPLSRVYYTFTVTTTAVDEWGEYH